MEKALLMHRGGQYRRRVTVLHGLRVALLISLLSFAATVLRTDANILSGGVTQYAPNVDYFPDKVHVHHATGFTVRYHPVICKNWIFML